MTLNVEATMPANANLIDEDEFTDGEFRFWRLPSGQVLPLVDEGDAAPSEAHIRRAAELTESSSEGGAR
jgi:hypothetical protein